MSATYARMPHVRGSSGGRQPLGASVSGGLRGHVFRGGRGRRRNAGSTAYASNSSNSLALSASGSSPSLGIGGVGNAGGAGGAAPQQQGSYGSTAHRGFRLRPPSPRVVQARQALRLRAAASKA